MELTALDRLLTPVIAGDIAKWDPDGPRAATVNYDVPLSGAISRQGISPLGFGGEVFPVLVARWLEDRE